MQITEGFFIKIPSKQPNIDHHRR